MVTPPGPPAFAPGGALPKIDEKRSSAANGFCASRRAAWWQKLPPRRGGWGRKSRLRGARKAAEQPRAVLPFGRLRREATKPLAAFIIYYQNSRPIYEGGQVFEFGRLRGRLRNIPHGSAHIHGAVNPALVAFTLSALRARLRVRSAMPTFLASASTSFAGRPAQTWKSFPNA
jgi:hypothetical protein